MKVIDPTPLMGGIRNLRDKIELLTKSWSLSNKGQEELSKSYLNQLANNFFDKPYALHESTLMFIYLFHGEQITEEIKKMLDEFRAAKKNYPAEYLRFRSYYISEKSESFLENRLDDLKDYLNNYDDLVNVYLYVKNKKEIPENISPSSKRFRQLKMFYGNIYESITSDLFVLACINNILNGRQFDIFNKMDLKKYMTINKANRANAFKDRLTFNPIVQHLDSKLRNASHHGAMKLRNNTIKYRSGGTGASHTISYIKYLEKCNHLMFASCILFAFGLLLLNDGI
ncbi:hypothetical protein SPB21_35170 [Leptothoe sp. ISB3NOV94-8A]